jgi:hypothetical protein
LNFEHSTFGLTAVAILAGRWPAGTGVAHVLPKGKHPSPLFVGVYGMEPCRKSGTDLAIGKVVSRSNAIAPAIGEASGATIYDLQI